VYRSIRDSRAPAPGRATPAMHAESFSPLTLTSICHGSPLSGVSALDRRMPRVAAIAA
jgi:hypothetical protein